MVLRCSTVPAHATPLLAHFHHIAAVTRVNGVPKAARQGAQRSDDHQSSRFTYFQMLLAPVRGSRWNAVAAAICRAVPRHESFG